MGQTWAKIRSHWVKIGEIWKKNAEKLGKILAKIVKKFENN